MSTPTSTLFTASASQRLQVADGTEMVSVSGQAMMFGGWFNFASIATQQILLTKGTVQNGSVMEYALFLYGGVGFRAFLADGTTLYATSYAYPGGFAAGAWHFILGWYDPASGGSVNFQFDDGTVSTAAGAIAPNTPALFTAGYDPGTVGSHTTEGNPFDGAMDSLFAIRRATAFTPAERTWLYNGGTGRVAADLGVGGTDGEFLAPAAGKGEWWDLTDNNPSHTGAVNGIVLASVDSGGPLTPTFNSGVGIPRTASLGSFVRRNLGFRAGARGATS